MAATVTLKGDGEIVEVDDGYKIVVNSPFLLVIDHAGNHLAAFPEAQVRRVTFHWQ